MILQTLIKYFFGFIIIIFVIWNRFLRDRLKTSLIFNIPLELFLFSYMCLIIFFIIRLYINVKKILNINKQTKIITNILQHRITLKVFSTIQEYIFNSPEFLYKELTKNVNLAPFIELPASYFTFYCNYPRVIVALLNIPLIIVAITFLISNIFYHDLSIFFKSLLLLIPMLFLRLWLFLLTSYSIRRLDHLYRFLNVNYVEEKNYFKLELKPDNELPQDDNFTVLQIKEKYIILCNLWEIYSTIYSFMKHIESYRNKSDPYINIATCLCYIIGWFYILSVNLNLLTINPEIFQIKADLEPFSQTFINRK